jgi:6-pyruvoyltetrahydropterin/6-carboxytetrahydropterin synthase
VDLLVDFRFSSAHRLPRHPGRCHRLHGHSYRLQVLVAGRPDAHSGMVVDFYDVEAAVAPVVDGIRGRCLNEVLENPTAEAIVAWLWLAIRPRLPQLAELRLWETEDCQVAYRGEPVPEGLLAPGGPGPGPSTALDVAEAAP